MSELQNKIDFAVVVSVDRANPNGDPLNGNRPREDYEGYGEISDVCIKRKIRNRLMDLGENVFVQSDDRCTDGWKSLKERADKCPALKKAKGNQDAYASAACEEWFDVRSFGQVFAFKNSGNGVSIGVRGPVSIHPAFSVDPVDVESLQITKSVNGENNTVKSPDSKSSDTMGMKHRILFGVYVIYGSINCQLAKKTEFSEEDAAQIQKTLVSLFQNDMSAARPEGSMEVRQVYWWRHSSESGQYSSAAVHRSLHIKKKEGITTPKNFDDYVVTWDQLEGLELQLSEGQVINPGDSVLTRVLKG